jgi:hypothetical protein
MSQARYFAVLIVVLVAGLWINILHYVQISREWQSANQQFGEIETQLEHLETACIKGR